MVEVELRLFKCTAPAEKCGWIGGYRKRIAYWHAPTRRMRYRAPKPACEMKCAKCEYGELVKT